MTALHIMEAAGLCLGCGAVAAGLTWLGMGFTDFIAERFEEAHRGGQ